jgi:hypothetical protein
LRVHTQHHDGKEALTKKPGIKNHSLVMGCDWVAGSRPSLWMFVVAAFLSLSMAFLMVSIQAIKAVLVNLVKSLCSE